MSGLTADHINQIAKAAGAGSGFVIPAAQIATYFNDAMTKYGGGQFSNKKRVAALLSECLMESAYFRTTVEYASTGSYQPFRGRTFIQITWKSNYAAFGKWCVSKGLLKKGQENYFVNNPTDLGQAQWSAIGGVWYFTQVKWGGKNLCQIADAGSSLAIGRAVNLGNPYSSATPAGQSARDAAYNVVMKLPNTIVPGSPQHAAPKPQTIRQMRKTTCRVAGFAAPGNLKAKKKKVVPKGTELMMVQQEQIDGKWWAKGAGGVWWPRWKTTPVKKGK